jgi:hypothetical protein
MKRSALILCLLPLLCMAAGCSSKLTRREAKRQIDAMMKPHPVGSKKIMSPGGYVPGYGLTGQDLNVQDYFSLGHHTISPTIDGSMYFPLINALNKAGYISVQEGGPEDEHFAGSTVHYDRSRSVSLTQKAGTAKKTGYSEDFTTGFSCYPEPNPTQCNLPPLIETGKDYQITGITQDEIHAKVNIQIPWKLTQIGLELKPYARPYGQPPDSYRASWEEFLNAHGASGNSAATILFQKFDDGWRITDEDGKSEKDLN